MMPPAGIRILFVPSAWIYKKTGLTVTLHPVSYFRSMSFLDWLNLPA
jgi:hypothetical protein